MWITACLHNAFQRVDHFVLLFEADLSIVQSFPKLINFIKELLAVRSILFNPLLDFVSFVHAIVALNNYE
jgi:hypothetical protein